jgi:hypothetical protein
MAKRVPYKKPALENANQDWGVFRATQGRSLACRRVSRREARYLQIPTVGRVSLRALERAKFIGKGG